MTHEDRTYGRDQVKNLGFVVGSLVGTSGLIATLPYTTSVFKSQSTELFVKNAEVLYYISAFLLFICFVVVLAIFRLTRYINATEAVLQAFGNERGIEKHILIPLAIENSRRELKAEEEAKVASQRSFSEGATAFRDVHSFKQENTDAYEELRAHLRILGVATQFEWRGYLKPTPAEYQGNGLETGV